MSKLIFLRGLPGSGKSTWAKSQPAVRVNKDDIRAELNKPWNQDVEKAVLKIRNSQISIALSQGRTVISDDTNLAPKHEKDLRNLAARCGAEFEVNDSFLKVSLEECILRDSKREGKARVGEKVIRDMYNKYILPTVTVEARPYVSLPNMPQAIICDLDGTLALHNGRSPYDYNKCLTDLPNVPVRDLLRRYHSSYTNIIYLSGRDGSCRELTLEWLRINYCPEGKLFMRAAGDQRKDYIVKTELFDKYIRENYDVLLCLDDRDQVVSLWRRMGLTCLQVAYGNF